MSDLDKLNLASADLATVLHGYTEARRRLNDQVRGHPRSGFGGSGGGGNSSPVESALGLSGAGDRGIPKDPAAVRLAAMSKLTHQVCRDLHLLAVLVASEQPHAPTDRDRREVAEANTAETLCQHCTDHRRSGDAQPVHRTGTVNGNLPLPMALCRWCYDRVRTDGRLPSGDRLERLRSFKADAVRA